MCRVGMNVSFEVIRTTNKQLGRVVEKLTWIWSLGRAKVSNMSERLGKCSREGTFKAPESVNNHAKSGDGQTEKPKSDIPPNITPKIVTVAN